ncbi:MAG TPA: RodZ domain-containing protein [Allosphingosinicella sp.]|jgi:transcriptional regulator with XRE-family HTH domain
MIEVEQDQGSSNPVGDRLRLAREEKGLALEDVARQTRIPLRHLEHIERGEWDSLPAITYSVGFARSYASAVGLDGAEVGAELRQQLGASRTSSPTASYYEPADPARVPPRSIALIAIVVGLLLLGAYLFWRSSAVDDDSPAEVAIAESETPTPAAPAPSPAASAPAPSANGPVVLSAVEDVWLKIDQASGPSLFNGILKAGQTYQVPANAQAPRIRTARAHVLRVTVGNTAIPPLGPPETTISNVSLLPADLAARASGAPAPASGAPAQAPAPTR